MNKENFVSQLLQIVALLSAIIVALSQYILKNSFRVFFGDNQGLYNISSLIALIISFVIILSIFANRYFLSSKFYLRKGRRDAWYKYLRNPTGNIVKEPFGITSTGVAIINVFLVIIAFSIFISSNSHPIVISISYVFMISLLVLTLSIFGIKLYLENDFDNRQKRQEESIQQKIKEFFIGEITIKEVSKDDSNLGSPVTRMTILRGGEEYKVVVNSNDPKKYFYIEKGAITTEVLQKQIQELLSIIANLQNQLAEVKKSGFESNRNL